MTTSKDGLGIGIVGCGMISEFQARAIEALPNAFVAGFYDSVAASAQARGEQFERAAYDDLGAMLADPAVGAVSVCTPSGAHLDPAVAAANAGKHVMVEKPLEITCDRCDEIIAACRENNVVLGAIFPRRFQPACRAVKRAVEAGRFGRLALGDVYIKWYRTQEYYDSGGWRGTWSMDGGGALMNQGIHGIDLLQWLMGGVQEVAGFTATLAHERIEVEDVATAAVRFQCGALGVIEGTTSQWPGTKIRVEIGGDQGNIVLEDETVLKWEFADEQPEDEKIRAEFGPREGLSGGGASDPKAIDFEGHRLQFEDFVGAIQSGGRPFCDGVEGRLAVDIITSIYRAAKEQRTIRLGS